MKPEIMIKIVEKLEKEDKTEWSKEAEKNWQEKMSAPVSVVTVKSAERNS